MEYRIVKEYTKGLNAEISYWFNIEYFIKYGFLYRMIFCRRGEWKALKKYDRYMECEIPIRYYTLEEAKEKVSFMCKRDNLVIPPMEISWEGDCTNINK